VPAAVTIMEKACVSEPPLPSVTFTVTLNVPADAGVQEISPVAALMLMPVGL